MKKHKHKKGKKHHKSIVADVIDADFSVDKETDDDDLDDSSLASKKSKKKKFSWMRAFIRTFLTLFVLLFFIYAALIVFTPVSADTSNSYYKTCLEKLNLSSPTLETWSYVDTKQTSTSIQKLYDQLKQVNNWGIYFKNIVKSAKYTSGNEFKEKNIIQVVYDLGFPAGQKIVNYKINTIVDTDATKTIIMTANMNGINYCSLWSFDKTSTETLITHVEIMHGFGVALNKPLLDERWKRIWDENLINY